MLEKISIKPSIYTMLKQSQLRWAGHVVRMPDHRLPKKLLFGKLEQGKRSQVGPKKRFKDNLKASLKAFNISHGTWEKKAKDRNEWRSAVHQGTETYETSRIAAAEMRRQVRKDTTIRSQTAPTIPCPVCQRTLGADRPHQQSAHTQTYIRMSRWSSSPRRTKHNRENFNQVPCKLENFVKGLNKFCKR